MRGVRLAVLLVALALAGLGPAAAQGFTGKDLIDRLTALDAELAKLKKETPDPGTFALGNRIDQIGDSKQRLVDELLSGLAAYGAPQNQIFAAFDCADRKLRRAGHMAHNNNKAEAIAGEIRDAAKCLGKGRRALGPPSQMPPEMNRALAKLQGDVDDAGDAVDKGKFDDKDGLDRKAVQKALKKLASRKFSFILDWFRAGTPLAQAAAGAYGVLFADILTGLDSVDVFLVDAEYGDDAKEIDKRIDKAIFSKEALLNSVRAANPDEGHFVTRAKGLEATRICIYLKGPVPQKGRVTLTGAAIMPPNPANFSLDSGNDMVSFIVQGTGDYTVSIERQQNDGSFKGGETDTVNVPGGGPSPATAPPAGQGYGSQPCPPPPE